MRILTISKCLPYVAGPSVFAFEEAKMMVKMGHQVDFLTYANYRTGVIPNFDNSILERSSINFHFVELPENEKTVVPMLETAMFSRVIEIAKTKRVDFINAHYAMPHGLIAVAAGKFLNIPAVVTIHGSDIWILPHDPAFCEASRLVFNSADLLITVSDNLYQGVLEFMGANYQKKIEVLEIAVDIDKFSKASPIDQLKRIKGPKVLFVGRLAKKQKRLDILFSAFKVVLQTFPQAKLVLVGVNSGEYQVENEIEGSGLKESVVFINGVWKELPNIYRATDLFVLCSDNEGFPNSLCEAAAAGLAVVTTPVGSVPNFFEADKNCLYAEIGNVENLAEKICELLTDCELRTKMGAANVRLAKKEFDLKTRCSKLLKLVAATKKRSRN